MKIYTKKGDQGFTSTLSGEKLPKSHLLLEFQGSIDEINANIGVVRSKIKGIDYLDNLLKMVQYHLFILGVETSSEFQKQYIFEEEIKFLEKEIDFMTEKLPPLNHFLYYSGIEAATYCQVLRSITRRAERVFVRWLGENTFPMSYQYINRLSDFFYTLGRYVNYFHDVEEERMVLQVNKKNS